MIELDEEMTWVFTALCALAWEISPQWTVVLRMDENQEDVAWILFPYEGDLLKHEDWSIAEDHPDKLTLKLREGLLFAHPSNTALSNWMSVQLKNKPELAGRII